MRGIDPDDLTIDCPRCEGTGKVRRQSRLPVDCSECQGTGQLTEDDIADLQADAAAEARAEDRACWY